MTDLEARLTRCFSAVFPKLPPERISAATPETVDDWDSVRFLTLLTVVQEEFGVTIDDDETETMHSFGSMLDFLRRHGT